VGAPWAFVGRVTELGRLVGYTTDSVRRGLIFGGAAGIGKSRLLREGLKTLDPDRYAVLTTTATEATSGLPFGGLAHVLPATQPAGVTPAGLLRWAVDAMRQQAGRRTIVLAVDDAHQLDQMSATLVYYMARSGQATVVATMRSGEPAPDPIRALWTEDLAERLDLGPLTEPETGDLLAEVLAGPVDSASVAKLWRLSQGNPLLVRELVMAAHAAGEITQAYGLRRWTGRLSLAPSLTEVIDTRLGTLEPEVREVVEYVAVSEPVGLGLLVAASDPVAVEAAEERQLIRVHPDGRRQRVRLAHPLYGELVRRRCPATRMRRQLARLADLVEAAGPRRRHDALRVSVWRLDSGTAHDPAALLVACQQAFSTFDIPLALRLGRAALAAGGGFDTAEGLATLLMFADQPGEASTILADATSLVTDDTQRARWLASRGMITYWGLAEESAADVLAAEAATLPPRERARAAGIEVMQRAHHLDRERAFALGEWILSCPEADDGPRALALAGVAHLRAAAGQPVRTMREMADADAGSARWRAETPYFQLALEVARGTAMIVAADLAAVAVVVAAEFAGMADAGDFNLGSGYMTVVRAQAARLAGRLTTAVQAARQACARLSAGVIFAGLASAELAHAAALSGASGVAAAAMADADRLHRPTMTILYPDLELARAWTAVSAGDLPGALRTLHRLIARLRDDGFAGYEVHALHDLVRLGHPAEAAERLAELSATVEGVFAPVAARHARAKAAGDGAGLLAVADDFAGLGLHLYAAEAATAAVAALRHERSPDAATALTRRAELLASCPDARTPALDLPQLTLTARERQIARLAAAGVPSKQIAERLYLSPRTVDNHLLRVYAKLGVSGRADLAAVLDLLDAAG